MSAQNRIAVIPARGGSKRIPRKNIRLLNEKPLIAYSIEAAMETQLFDRVIVSTDDEEIADVARSFGADIPFLRPANLSDAFTGTTPVMQHALNYLKEKAQTPDEACLIYATCPLLTSEDLIKGYQALEGASFSFAATTFDFPIQRALCLDDSGKLTEMFPEHIAKRSQDLVEAIHDAGQFYWARTETWLEDGHIFGEGSKPVMLPRYRIQDLDTEEDWQRLTQLMALYSKS